MRKTTFVLLVAVTAAAVAGVVYQVVRPGDGAVAARGGETFLPELQRRANDAREVVLTRSSGTATLKQQGDRWIFVEKGDYPANGEQVRRVLVELAELRLVEAKTRKADLYPRLQVEDPTGKDARSTQAPVAKSYTGPIKAGGGDSNGYMCGDAVNKMTRNLAVRANRQEMQLLYIAASSEREVSYASPQGSTATVAWAQCLENTQTDSNRDGFLSGEELRQCAQSRISGGRHRQTITLAGNTQLPVGFITGASASAPVQPERTLEAIRTASDPGMALTLNLSRQQLSIARRDRLDFSVTSPQAGYLYLLHIGSDGKTFDVLFPNDIDANNYVSAGTHRFPRPQWAVEATGPEGVGYVMAYLSATPKNLRDGMNKIGPFASTLATRSAASKLGVVATGAGQDGGGRYGTSAVVPVTEVR